jgi:hypothetical protein
VDPGAAETFRELLQGELTARTGAAFVQPERACADVPCAVEVGGQSKAQVVVFGSLNALGQKLIVSTTVVDAVNGRVASNQKIAVDRLEDLDKAAVRIAEAITLGTNTDETAALGTIVHEEVKPDVRREGARGLGLRVGALLPLGASYANSDPGAVIDFTYWYETRNFAIEPRLGLRFSADDDNGNSFFELPMDIGAYYILGDGDFAPFIGGGGGLRWVSETVQETVLVGSVITTEHQAATDDSAFGFGAFARAGVLLLRTYTVRLALNFDYNVTFVELHDSPTPQSFTAGISVYF